MKSKIVNHGKKDDAVSPVIGVMLMIVVTVVIAAVVALFATNVVTSTEAAPVVVLDMNASQGSPDANSKLVMSTRGGDPLDLTKLKVVVSDSTGDYGLSFVGLDQKGVGDHLEIGEKLTVFTLENIKTVASSATGGNIEEVAGIITSSFVAGNKIHVMVTFNENAIIYDKNLIVKSGTEIETGNVYDVLGELPDSVTSGWVYNDADHTSITSSNAFTITYGTTTVSPYESNSSIFKGIKFSGGVNGDFVEKDSCVIGFMGVEEKSYNLLINGEKESKLSVVLQKGDVISVSEESGPEPVGTDHTVTLTPIDGASWNPSSPIKVEDGSRIRLATSPVDNQYRLIIGKEKEPCALLTVSDGKALTDAVFKHNGTSSPILDVKTTTVDEDGAVELVLTSECTVNLTTPESGGLWKNGSPVVVTPGSKISMSLKDKSTDTYELKVDNVVKDTFTQSSSFELLHSTFDNGRKISSILDNQADVYHDGTLNIVMSKYTLTLPTDSGIVSSTTWERYNDYEEGIYTTEMKVPENCVLYAQDGADNYLAIYIFDKDDEVVDMYSNVLVSENVSAVNYVVGENRYNIYLADIGERPEVTSDGSIEIIYSEP